MIGGLDKQIKEIKKVNKLPVKHPELFEALGIAQPKGMLLCGVLGSGKMLLAHSVAHHMDCTFICVSDSELGQKFIREGARMVTGSSWSEGGCGGNSEVQLTKLELLKTTWMASRPLRISRLSWLLLGLTVVLLDSAHHCPGRIS